MHERIFNGNKKKSNFFPTFLLGCILISISDHCRLTGSSQHNGHALNQTLCANFALLEYLGNNFLIPQDVSKCCDDSALFL